MTAAERSASGAQGWQPIATAPRDESKMLLWCPQYDDVRLGWWDTEFRPDGWDEANDRCLYVPAWTDGTVADWGMEENQELHPTHWMPLPSAPEAPDA